MKKVTGYEVDGVIYRSKKEAEQAESSARMRELIESLLASNPHPEEAMNVDDIMAFIEAENWRFVNIVSDWLRRCSGTGNQT